MPARRRDPLAREEPAELQVAATNGSMVTDSRGRKYIDFVMGWCVGNFGWRPAAIAKAIERFKGPDYVYPGYAYAPWRELARLLASLAPRPLTTCFRATGGSEAVDLALQAAMIHTGRRALLSLEGSYHGNTLGGLSIGATDNREQIKNLLPHCGKVAPPLDATALRRIEQRLKRRDNDGAFTRPTAGTRASVAAAIAALRDLKANRARLLTGVAEMSEYFRVRLLQLEFDRPAAVRIQGLAIGIDVGDEDYADTIHDKCRRNGLLVSTEGSTVLLLPSLAIDKRTATLRTAPASTVSSPRQLQSACMSVKSHFATKDPLVFATYRRVVDVARTFGPVAEEAKKTSIHLVRHTAFAGIATRRSSLVLTLKSGSDIRSPRVEKREQTSANRWHVEVCLTAPAQVDRQLAAWLRAAYDLAGP